MRLGILGPLEVVGDDGVRLDPAAARQRRLLLALLVWHGEPVSVDRLVDAVWDQGALPHDPVRALRTYVTRLRARLEPQEVGGRPRILVGGGDWYTMRLDGHELDAVVFERDLAQGVEQLDRDPGAALHCLQHALARWRGPALMEVADEHWALPEAARLEELRVTALEHRYAAMLGTGRHLEALGGLEAHVHRHPLRERPHALLMIALDLAGRASEAGEEFLRFRGRLADEAGLDPSADLQALHERLLVRSDAMVVGDVAAGGVWDELPPAAGPLIGRDRDVAAVADLLAAHRFLTLTGVGGVGKTRLAIEVARAERDRGRRIVFVPLDRVGDGDDVADAVFAALQLPSHARVDAVDGLVRVLHGRRCLLVLDNCEHVLDGAAALIARLMRDCPSVSVLATSRELIGLEGERVHRVPSLDEVAGAALFADRASAVGGLSRPCAVEEAAVAAICRRLDGIPLAIELAAARTAHMTAREIAERLAERFWLLSGGRRALPRHQTLAATIDWSHDLLGEDERALLRAAAVFVDGFDPAALAAVAGEDPNVTVDVLRSLVNKSLVEVTASAGRGRYRLLETVRLYALGQLVEMEELGERRQRHAAHFLAAALAHAPRVDDLPPGGGARTMCRLRLDPTAPDEEADLANHHAALDWLARHDLAGMARLAARLGTTMGYRSFLDVSGRYLRRGDAAAALEDVDERALYLVASALHATFLGDWADELRFARAAMAVATDPATRACAVALAAQASLAHDMEQVPQLVEQGLRELPDDARHARLLLRGQETLRLVMIGALPEAATRLGAHARAGDVFAASELLLVLHVLDEDQRALDLAPPRGAEPEPLALWGYRWPLLRALASAAAGRPGEAAGHLLRAGQRIASSPVRLLDCDVLLGCAAYAHHAGDHDRALHLLAVVAGKFRSPGSLVLYRAYHDRVRPHVDDRRAAGIAEVARDLRVQEALADELTHLEALAGEDPGVPRMGRSGDRNDPQRPSTPREGHRARPTGVPASIAPRAPSALDEHGCAGCRGTGEGTG